MHFQMIELIAQSKALQYKNNQTISFADDEIEDLKDDKHHLHILISEFNAALTDLSVLNRDRARYLLDVELRKINTD